MTENATIRQDLRRLADEIRVQIHLAGMEAKTAWENLEPKLRQFEHKAEDATGKLGDELTKWGHELREQAGRIAAQVRKH